MVPCIDVDVCTQADQKEQKRGATQRGTAHCSPQVVPHALAESQLMRKLDSLGARSLQGGEMEACFLLFCWLLQFQGLKEHTSSSPNLSRVRRRLIANASFILKSVLKLD